LLPCFLDVFSCFPLVSFSSLWSPFMHMSLPFLSFLSALSLFLQLFQLIKS
jgi:hypothetical protein